MPINLVSQAFDSGMVQTWAYGAEVGKYPDNQLRPLNQVSQFPQCAASSLNPVP